MTTLVKATTSVEAAESSTASTTETAVAATAATAEAIPAPPSAVSAAAAASILPLEPEPTEIVAISLQIRRALECPICLTLMSVMSCFCPNGHAMCQSCMLTLLNASTTNTLCPLCRTPMVQSASMSAMVIKLAEATPLVKVACSNWAFGCPDLVPVRHVNEHESLCRYVPDVPCLVPVCQWVGMYEQLYEHVFNVHPGVTVESSTNLLNVTDLHEISRNRRRTYLVRSAYGMMWVLVSRGTRSRIQTGIFMVKNTRGDQYPTSDPNHNRANPRPPDFLYRITWFDGNDRTRTKSRTKQVYWSTALKEGCHTAVLPNAYSMFRSRSGRMEISWFRRYDGNSQVRHSPSST